MQAGIGLWIAVVAAVVTAVCAAIVAVVLLGQGTGKPAPDPVAALTKGLDVQNGLVPVYSDTSDNRILMALPAPDPETGISLEAIHVGYLRTGLGSNPVGLDRGRTSDERIVRFEVTGDKVFLVAPNTRFTAQSENRFEVLAAEESFARSVLWAADIEATMPDGRVLIDIAPFLLTDMLGIAAHLNQRDQGTYSLQADRSAPLPRETLVFPDNVELEAQLTFASTKPGPEARATAPDSRSLTFTIHHSFVRLPDPGFKPRRFDPRLSNIAVPVTNYAAPLTEPLESRFILRHRLEKTDPSAERSPVKEPIVFYLDRGAPEPVRTALMEGASWWAEAFEAAGFQDAYRVELLPEDAHPLDARYNVINWVHRSTRGWSYGSPIYDPRTGEIIKAVITLGSLRVRQDQIIFEGLLDAAQSGAGGPNDPIQVSLQRLRQLSAHEVGHGLGFAHNMGASADNRASVMDYPAPLVRLASDGTIDLSDAYTNEIGAWDKIATRYVYEEFPPGTDEAAALDAIAREAAQTRVFVTDPHSRPLGSAHPQGSLWDNGSDPVVELERLIAVRAAALADYGLDNLPEGAPVSDLRTRIVPIYLYHRYQIEAAAKLLGGARFGYGVKGDGSTGVTPVAAADQARALAVLLRTIEPGFLALPQSVSRLLSPPHRSWFDGASREAFRGDTSPVFDETGAAATAAGLTFDALLHEHRLSRIVQFHSRDERLPALEDVLSLIAETVFAPAAENAHEAAIRMAVAHRYITALTPLLAGPPVIAAAVETHMRTLPAATGDEASPLAARILRILEEPDDVEVPDTHPVPPGSPIGAAHACHSCWFCE